MATLSYGSVIGAGPGYTVVSTPYGPMTVSGDRALRNNNPGNIRAGSYANSAGAIGQDGGLSARNGHFAVFPNRATGIAAQAGLIFGSKSYRNLTLRQAIARYAPATENNTVAYAAAVAAASGVSLDTKMKDIPASKQAAVMSAMHAVEGNTSAKAYDAQGNLINTLDAVSASTPATAPTPYGPDSQMADTTAGAPIGHVSRAPLGPAAPPSFSGLATPRGIGAPQSAPQSAPSGPGFSGMATPRGVGSITPSLGPAAPASFSSMATPQGVNTAPSRPSVSSSFTSQDEKSNTGSIANAPNAGGFVSQDERASMAERLGIPAVAAPAPTAPSVATVAPARPSVAAPAAVPSVSVAQPVPARVSVPAAPSRPSITARPSLSPADVRAGAIGTAQTSTPGTTVSRVNSFGPSYTTNKYGAVTATDANGNQMAAWGGVPSNAISGPLSNTGIATPAAPSTGGLFGPKAKSATGAIAGAAIGSYALGPLGGLLGAAIGKNVAQGKAPLSGIFGSNVATHMVDTFDGQQRFANAQSGLGFPSAPSNPGGFTATSSNNSMAGMRGISPGAAAAIGKGQGGLY